MPRPFKPAELARRRREIAELYIQRVSQYDIAARLGISIKTVNADLKVIQAQWVEKSIADIGAIKAAELAKLDWLEMEYTQGWVRSQKLFKRIKLEDVIKEDSIVAVKQTVEKLKPVGDPRFLEGIERCVKLRGDILGLWAPKLARVEGGFVMLNVGVNVEDL